MRSNFKAPLLKFIVQPAMECYEVVWGNWQIDHVSTIHYEVIDDQGNR